MTIRSVQELLAEARAAIEHISVEDALALLNEGNTVFVDVREQVERYQSGGIAGSVHTPRGFLEFMADPNSPMHEATLSSGKRLVVYCASGGRSVLAAKMLTDMGIANVVNLEGGFAAWNEAGGPTERDDPGGHR